MRYNKVLENIIFTTYFMGTFPALFPINDFLEDKLENNTSLMKYHYIWSGTLIGAMIWPASIPTIKYIEFYS